MVAVPHIQTLERISAPSIKPITLEECKEQLRIDGDADDVYLTRLIGAATSYTDALGVLGKAIITQTWRQWIGNNPSAVQLALGPAQSLSAVKYYDTDGVLQNATLSDFELVGLPSSRIVRPKSGYVWPTAQSRPDAICVEYVCGYGDAVSDVPEAVRQGLLMLVAHWYESRETSVEKQYADLPFGFNELIQIERGNWYG